MRGNVAIPDDQDHDAGPVEIGVANEARFARGPRSPTRFRNDMTALRTQESPTKTVGQMYHAAKISTRK
jgi:hypothetical protein